MKILAIGRYGLEQALEVKKRATSWGDFDRVAIAYVKFEGDPDYSADDGVIKTDLQMTPEERVWATKYAEVKAVIRTRLGKLAFLDYDMALLFDLLKSEGVDCFASRFILERDHKLTTSSNLLGLPDTALKYLATHPDFGELEPHEGFSGIFGVRPSEIIKHRRPKTDIYGGKAKVDFAVGDLGDRNATDIFTRLLLDEGSVQKPAILLFRPSIDSNSSASTAVKLSVSKADEKLIPKLNGTKHLILDEGCNHTVADVLEAMLWLGSMDIPKAISINRFAVDYPFYLREPRITAIDEGGKLEVESANRQHNLVVTPGDFIGPATDPGWKITWKLVLPERLRHRLERKNWNVFIDKEQLSKDKACLAPYENLVAVIGLADQA